MPIMCTVQLPKGKKQEQIQKALTDISNALMEDFGADPKQVRVTIEELPRGRYIAGGVMDYEMPDFNQDEISE
ncbi:MAG: tautomerase family protein [Lachnospiraceae bacterium]|nr:tautomerase family protein [Lachnospiraceae bacterium]